MGLPSMVAILQCSASEGSQATTLLGPGTCAAAETQAINRRDVVFKRFDLAKTNGPQDTPMGGRKDRLCQLNRNTTPLTGISISNSRSRAPTCSVDPLGFLK